MFSTKNINTAGVVVGTLAMTLLSSAHASASTFSATGTNAITGDPLSASVVFNYSQSSNQLSITLINNDAVSDPSDALSAVFWDYAGSPLNLSLTSAIAPTVVTDSTGTVVTTGTNVNLKNTDGAGHVEWGFASTTASSGLGGSGGTAVSEQYGLGTAGFGISPGFGLSGGQQFNYGIINGYTNPNPAVKGGTFVQGQANFVLSGLPTGFDITKIEDVRFQYGTALSDAALTASTSPSVPTNVPEPSATLALGLMALGMLKLSQKKHQVKG